MPANTVTLSFRLGYIPYTYPILYKTVIYQPESQHRAYNVSSNVELEPENQ